MLRNLLRFFLRFFATRILKKYHPEIIAITGSVGKSSTKEAVFAVLAPHFRVRKSTGNLNTEIGVPLVIIGEVSGKLSVIGWLRIFIKSAQLFLKQALDYPEILILELAADRPGDIAYLTKFLKPKIGIITTVGLSHIENFGTIERIAIEKGTLPLTLPKDGCAILNYDDPRVREMSKRTKANVITYGFAESADVRALEITVRSKLLEWKEDETDVGETAAKIAYQGNTVPLLLPNVLGRTHIYAALAGVCVGIIKGLNLLQIVEALRCYMPPPGRLKILPGIKKTYLIDDTYNAAPISVYAALEVLKGIEIPASAKRYAVVGDMLELGSETENAHYQVGKRIGEVGVDELIVVGPRATLYARGAKDVGMDNERIYHFSTVEEAGRFVQDRISAGDLVLIKASRGMHFEKIVKELMANPTKADQLLVH